MDLLSELYYKVNRVILKKNLSYCRSYYFIVSWIILECS